MVAPVAFLVDSVGAEMCGRGRAGPNVRYFRGSRVGSAGPRVALAVCLVVLLAACGTKDENTSRSVSTPPTSRSSLPAPSTSTPPSTTLDLSKATLEQEIAFVADTTGTVGAPNTLFKLVGNNWRQPAFIRYREGQIPPSKCSTDPDPRAYSGNAFYCSTDNTVAYNLDWLAQLYREQGRFFPAAILMHELGHAFNHNTRHEGGYSLEEENQADCIAGVEAKYAEQVGFVAPKDLVGSAFGFMSIGESSKDPWWRSGAHGTPYQRFISYMTGANEGAGQCRTIGETPGGKAVKVGAFTVPVPDGVRYAPKGQSYELDYGNSSFTDFTSLPEPSPIPANNAELLKTLVAEAFAGSTYRLGDGLTSVTFTDANGRQQTYPLGRFISRPPDSAWAYFYGQTIQGRPVQGLLIILNRPGVGHLAIDTFSYTNSIRDAVLGVLIDEGINGLVTAESGSQ